MHICLLPVLRKAQAQEGPGASLETESGEAWPACQSAFEHGSCWLRRTGSGEKVLLSEGEVVPLEAEGGLVELHLAPLVRESHLCVLAGAKGQWSLCM